MLELAILGLLKERSMHGYQLSKRLTDSLGGLWRVSYGSLYPTLKRLGPARATTGALLFGWLMLAPCFVGQAGWREYGRLTAAGWTAVLFLGVACSGLGYLFWYGALERMEQFGVPRPIVSFILPLGYSFNLDGSTLYLSLAAIFVAQAANVELTVGQQITMLLTLMLTSKGVAGVPRASLVILAGTLASYNLPLEGITLILGVDAIMDMARTTVNVTGNCLASVVVARWEGQFEPRDVRAAEG